MPTGGVRTVALAAATTLPAGETLATLDARGRVAGRGTYMEAERIVRAPLACAEPVDPAVAPFAAPFLDPARARYEAARVACVALPGATLIGADGLVLFEGRVVQDTASAVEAWRLGTGVAGVGPDGSVTLRAPCPPAVRHAGHVFVGYAGNWRNYGHWIAETLPRLLLFDWVARQVAGVRLALPRFPAGSAPARATALLGIPEAAILRVGDGDAVAADMLWCVGRLDVWDVPRLVARAGARLAAGVAIGVAEARGGLASRLYLRRGTDTRVMTGYDALRPVLDAFGFRTIVAQALSLDDQVRAFRSARCVVGETSAGLANVVFCAPGASVLELFNPAFVQPAHWSLASLGGLRYGFLVGRHVATPGLEAPSQNAAYLVTPEQLADGLRRMGLSAGPLP